MSFEKYSRLKDKYPSKTRFSSQRNSGSKISTYRVITSSKRFCTEQPVDFDFEFNAQSKYDLSLQQRIRNENNDSKDILTSLSALCLKPGNEVKIFGKMSISIG